MTDINQNEGKANSSSSSKQKSPALNKQAISLILVMLLLIGIITFICAFGTLWGGKKLDAHFGTTPWIMIGMGIIGMVLSIWGVIMIATSFTKKIQLSFSQEKKEKEADK